MGDCFWFRFTIIFFTNVEGAYFIETPNLFLLVNKIKDMS